MTHPDKSLLTDLRVGKMTVGDLKKKKKKIFQNKKKNLSVVLHSRLFVSVSYGAHITKR